MRIFGRKPGAIAAISLFGAMIFGVSPTVAETTADEHHQHQPAKQQDWPGIYNGFTPCADCFGIKTTLALNKNNTYILLTQFAGKSEREYVEKGSYTLNSDDKLIELTPRKGGKDNQKYLIGDNTLTQLDANGKRFTGKDAERYTLRRTDVTDQGSQSHAH